VIAAMLNGAIDMRGDRAANDGTDEAHQAFGFAQLSRRMACTTTRNVS